MKDVVITDCACVAEDGFGNRRTWQSWDGAAPGADDLRWSMFSETPFDAFRRLDALCRYALSAVELLTLPPPAAGGRRPDLGLCLGTQYGSLDADIAFIRTANNASGPSPRLFTYTLPSTALGEIAIRHRITGPNLCVLCGPDSGMAALREGTFMVADGTVAGCVCLGCDAVSMPVAGRSVGYAYAFVLERAPAACEREGPLARLIPGDAGCTPARCVAAHDALPALFRYVASSARPAGEPPCESLCLRAAAHPAAPCLLCNLDAG
ncbi:MAG: hypothetical protein GXY85_01590 [Candidatus Brocadiaceae bacterium]|nr:hypothetical protein [Candidatus Brocadiaceae bacterium]